MTIHICKLGRLFKSHGLINRERTPSWAVALALLLYPAGLSLRRIASLLTCHGLQRAHTSVWYWIQTLGSKLVVWRGPLPKRIVLDETRVQVGGRDCWIFAAIDPLTWRILYVEPCWRRDAQSTDLFIRNLVEFYGQHPKEVLTDGGGWYRTMMPLLSFWELIGTWQIISGGGRNSIEGWFGEFLKRRVKDFDCYFPSWDRGLRSVKNWLKVYCWWYNGMRTGSLAALI